MGGRRTRRSAAQQPRLADAGQPPVVGYPRRVKGAPYSTEDPRFGPWLVSVVEFCDEIVHFLQAHDGHPLHSHSDRIVCNADGATVYYREGISADGFVL